MTNLTGYLHPQYAQSLAGYGQVRRLPKSGSWILERAISGTPFRDAMGLYPLFACESWSGLAEDLAAFEESLVSLSLVTDPFGDYSEELLASCFPEKHGPFKQHYVIDLREDMQDYVSKHHRRYARKALKSVLVEPCPNPLDYLEDWIRMYATLIHRHKIGGFLSFSEEIFRLQFEIPGRVAFRASLDGETVGMLIWYHQGAVGYYHLGAYSQTGYAARASFALFWKAIENFTQQPNIRWLNLGASPGIKSNANNGLDRFKLGWSTGTKTAYFCGRIFDQEKYRRICELRQVSDTGYFPAYRKGEFRDT